MLYLNDDILRVISSYSNLREIWILCQTCKDINNAIKENITTYY